MKIWRGVTLALWIALISACTSIVLYNHAAQNSILNPTKSKQWLATSQVYDNLRDSVITDMIIGQVNEAYPYNKLLNQSIIQATLADTFSRQELQKRAEPAIDSIYGWLDSRRSQISFSIPINDKLDAFYQSLEKHLGEKITKLPACSTNHYPPEEALLEKQCRPPYITPKEVTQAVMSNIRANQLDIEVITPDTLHLSTATSPLGNTPTYISYMWALNMLSIAILLFSIVFVLWSRRTVGVIAIGVSLVLAGIVIMLVQLYVAHLPPENTSHYATLVREVKNTLMPHLSEAVTRRALTSIVVGAICIAAATTWRWRQRKVVD